MGVRGLWKILEPTAQPVQLESLRGKVLAIDASIWIYHFLKAMRDSKGTVLAAAHIIGFFRRICKLLFYEIKPVFVFDGSPPILKKETTSKRQERRVNREQTARNTANKLLTIQLQRAQQQNQQANQPQNKESTEIEIVGDIPDDAVYFDDLTDPQASSSGGAATAAASSSNSIAASSKPFVQTDQYHLPEIGQIAPIRGDDKRMLTQDELDEYSKHFTSQARGGFIDTSLVDFHSKEFERLPLETQYQLLNMARTKSRLRMGFTSDELNKMFPNEMEFSKFQISRVAQRNFFTQRLMNLVGLEDDLTRRVSSEKDKEYFLKRTDQGWSLSLENEKPKPKPEHDNDQEIKQEQDAEQSSEDDFEEVDIEPSATNEAGEENESDLPEQIDLTAEESAKIDELFGFEAKVTRQNFYDKLMDEVEADEEQTEERPKKSLGSMMFAADSEDDEQDKEEPAEKDEAKKDAQPAVPWFENNLGFEQMELAGQADPNFVDTNDISESDSELEVVDIDEQSQKPQAEEDAAVQREVDIVSEEPANSEDVHVVSEQPAPEVLEEPQVSVSPSPQERPETVTEESGPKVAEEPEVLDTTVKTSEKPTTEKPTAEEPVEEEPTAEEPTAEEPAAEPAAEEPATEEPTAAEPAAEELATEEPAIEEPAAEEPVQEPQTAPAKEYTPPSAETVERAEEEARDDEEENENIAGMLVAEAEENERFAKNLAETTHHAWTAADEQDYQDQISLLRKQFANNTRDADNISTDMVQECQELLQLFGIPYITAPAEAEAQCAELRNLKLVDGIVTDDGDTFLFDDNAVVYRNMFSQAKFVEFYTTKEIRKSLGLDRHKLIDLAFLLGSDYTEGILGIGPVTGVELIAEFGSLTKFAEWWNEAQRFPDDADISTPFRRRMLKQFKSRLFLPEDFPRKAVVDAYLHPSVDKDSTKFSWGTPDLDNIRKMLAVTAGWSSEKVNAVVLPVVQEAKRRELLRKTVQSYDQSHISDYYTSVVQNPEMGSKRTHQAIESLRKRAKTDWNI